MDLVYQYSPAIWPSVLTITVLAVLIVHAWQRRNLPGVFWFIVYCLLVTLFLVVKVIGYHAIDLETKVFWFHIEYPLWLPGTTAMTCFVLEYVWPGRWVTRRTLSLLSVVPLLVFLLTFSNDVHHLLFRGFGFDGSVDPQYGPVGNFLLFYNSGLQVVSVTALAWLFVRSPQHRWPAILILLAELLLLLYIVIDPAIKEAGFFYVPEKAIAVVACAIALFGYHIFDPIPLACQTVLEQLRAGMLVLDLEGRVISMNPAAEDILNISEERGKGRPARELLPDWPASHFLETGELQFELALGEEPDRRHYRLRDWPLNDFRGQAVGQLLLLTDVTDQKRTQAQILEQQRSLAILHERDQLARELHDNLGQVIAFVNIQGQTIHRLLSQGDHATAENYVGRLLEVVRDADMDIRDSIAGLRTSLSEYGFHPVLTDYLTNFERNFGIRTMLEGPFTCTAGLFEPLVEVQLLRILQEALTNVRKHAKARTVWIAFVQEGSCVSVTIRDNGQGFDANSIGRRPHGHVGLRVMRERAEEVGGSLSLISIPGEGTELVVRVPVKMSHQAQRIHQPGAENPG